MITECRDIAIMSITVNACASGSMSLTAGNLLIWFYSDDISTI